MFIYICGGFAIIALILFVFALCRISALADKRMGIE